MSIQNLVTSLYKVLVRTSLMTNKRPVLRKLIVLIKHSPDWVENVCENVIVNNSMNNQNSYIACPYEIWLI